MTTKTSVEFHAVNAGGTQKVFSGLEAEERARDWVFAAKNRRTYGELMVLEVTTTTTTRQVYKPRPLPPVTPAPAPMSVRDLAIPVPA